MEGKPLYYDGSVPHTSVTDRETSDNSSFEITDEIRKNMAGNPYGVEQDK